MGKLAASLAAAARATCCAPIESVPTGQMGAMLLCCADRQDQEAVGGNRTALDPGHLCEEYARCAQASLHVKRSRESLRKRRYTEGPMRGASTAQLRAGRV